MKYGSNHQSSAIFFPLAMFHLICLIALMPGLQSPHAVKQLNNIRFIGLRTYGREQSSCTADGLLHGPNVKLERTGGMPSDETPALLLRTNRSVQVSIPMK